MRPDCADNIVGQTHILSKGKPLYKALQGQGVHSMILWGPPGSGKTTLAKLICKSSLGQWHQLSAVSSGVKQIRDIIDQAKLAVQMDVPTILFVDEVHRFNKSQQDAFLPFVEDGTICLIGATTENPAFELNNALLSRARVYTLKPLNNKDLHRLLEKTLSSVQGLADMNVAISGKARELLVQLADGDARRLLGILELASDLAQTHPKRIIKSRYIKAVAGTRVEQMDKGGDYFYDQISALHKSVRGSDPDAALYWASRMINGGVDPHYLLRRLLRMASEDIGNADPRAISLVLQAWQGYDRLGSPEGDLLIMQAVIYVAIAAKSNAGYVAAKLASRAAKDSPSAAVPVALRNAPTKLAKSLGHGKEYRYSHDENQAFSAGQRYFPDEVHESIFYNPVERGLEIKIAEKLRVFRAQNVTARKSE